MTLSALAGSTTPGAHYRSLQEVVDARPRTGATLVAENLDFVTALGEPVGMAARLRGILADEDAIRVIAGRSYRHVNHFDKIVLVDSGDPAGYRLTLHVWDPPYTETEIRDELIHDHRFSFWSHILTGELVSENFTRAAGEDGIHFRQYRYIPEKLEVSTQGNFYEFVGDAPLARTEPSREQAGRSYHLYYERIHRVVLPTEQMTATAVLRGPRERSHSNVYNTAYPDQDVRARNVMFSTAALRSKLSRLVSAIERTRLGR